MHINRCCYNKTLFPTSTEFSPLNSGFGLNFVVAPIPVKTKCATFGLDLGQARQSVTQCVDQHVHLRPRVVALDR